MRKFNKGLCLGVCAWALFFWCGHVYAADESALDTDQDGLSDYDEVTYFKTDPNKNDTDGDSYIDAAEVYSGNNPLGLGRAATSTKRVEVNLTNQTLTYFSYNKPLATIPVSTGVYYTPTPKGNFNIKSKVPVIRYTGVNYDFPNTKWNLSFLPHYYLHGAYWHNQFGIRPMSHGCVNISYKDVEKMYNFLDVDVAVKIFGTAPKMVPVAERAGEATKSI